MFTGQAAELLLFVPADVALRSLTGEPQALFYTALSAKKKPGAPLKQAQIRNAHVILHIEGTKSI